MLACDGVCVRVGVRRGEEVVTPNLAPVGSKNKNVGTPPHTPLGLSPELGIKFVRRVQYRVRTDDRGAMKKTILLLDLGS
jgi:hypothetical protein